MLIFGLSSASLASWLLLTSITQRAFCDESLISTCEDGEQAKDCINKDVAQVEVALTDSSQASVDNKNAWLGISTELSKEEQIRQKNSKIDREGIFYRLPQRIQESLYDVSRGRFVAWLDEHTALREHPACVTRGKAAIIQLFTEEESDAIIQCMYTEPGQPGVMSADETSQLYPGRLNTARYLISDAVLAERVLHRIQHMHVADGNPLLGQMHWALTGSEAVPAMRGTGLEVISAGHNIRLVTTEHGGGQVIHADISEVSEDRRRVSVFTFQCYLNPESYEGGNFQLYPMNKSTGKVGSAVDIPVTKGVAVLFAQEDAELQHGGGEKLSGQAKRALRGNLEVSLANDL